MEIGLLFRKEGVEVHFRGNQSHCDQMRCSSSRRVAACVLADYRVIKKVTEKKVTASSSLRLQVLLPADSIAR